MYIYNIICIYNMYIYILYVYIIYMYILYIYIYNDIYMLFPLSPPLSPPKSATSGAYRRRKRLRPDRRFPEPVPDRGRYQAGWRLGGRYY